MPRQPLLTLLHNHTAATPDERQMLADVIEFVNANPNCFERSLLAGHITGSAWIVNAERTHTLLIHHAKLDKWFQPGGHCDGNSDVLAVAIKEAVEETGLAVTPLSTAIFDVDNHIIPQRGNTPAHIHYDIRFLLQAARSGHLTLNPEIKDIRWVPMADVATFNASESILRMARKTTAQPQ